MGLRTLLNALVPIPEETAVFDFALAAGALLEDRGGGRTSGAGQAVPDGAVLADLADPVLVLRVPEGTDGDADVALQVRGESVPHRAGLALAVLPDAAALGTFRYTALLAGVVQEPAGTIFDTEVFVIDISLEVSSTDLFGKANGHIILHDLPGAFGLLDTAGAIFVLDALGVAHAYLARIWCFVVFTRLCTFASCETNNAVLSSADLCEVLPGLACR